MSYCRYKTEENIELLIREKVGQSDVCKKTRKIVMRRK